MPPRRILVRIATTKVRSPGLVFSFEPLVVCQLLCFLWQEEFVQQAADRIRIARVSMLKCPGRYHSTDLQFQYEGG